jgi:hypothetical protein
MKNMKQRVLKVHKADNVIVALQNLQKGETIHYQRKNYVLAADIIDINAGPVIDGDKTIEEMGEDLTVARGRRRSKGTGC